MAGALVSFEALVSFTFSNRKHLANVTGDRMGKYVGVNIIGHRSRNPEKTSG